MHTVVKPFHTPSRRFAAGQSVTPADVSGPVPFEHWVALGHIAAPVGPGVSRAGAKPAPAGTGAPTT